LKEPSVIKNSQDKPTGPNGKRKSARHLIIVSLEETEVVAEGTEAMKAYYEIMYGDYRDNPKVQANWRDLLLSYCELDTMAMVIIWTYWKKAVV